MGMPHIKLLVSFFRKKNIIPLLIFATTDSQRVTGENRRKETDSGNWCNKICFLLEKCLHADYFLPFFFCLCR